VVWVTSTGYYMTTAELAVIPNANGSDANKQAWTSLSGSTQPMQLDRPICPQTSKEPRMPMRMARSCGGGA
jgi:hypothetical protein